MAKVDMIMPQMGESIAEGTIIKWLKKEGDKVEKDEIILEISTDKVDSEIPSPQAGVIKKLLAPEGETVQVGSVIAHIETEGVGDAAAETPAAQPAKVEPTKEIPAEEVTVVAEPALAQTQPAVQVSVDGGSISAIPRTDRAGKKFFSPLVRSIARTEGLNIEELERIEGTGAKGRVTKKDVLTYLERRSTLVPTAPAAVPVPAYVPPAQPEFSDDRVEIIPMDNMRKSIAAHMVHSVQTSPHVFAVSEADMTNLVKFRGQYKDAFLKKTGTKLSYMPFIVEACVKALLDYPLVNSSVDGDKIIRKKYIGIGMAVALENSGLIVPVIKNADSLNIVGLARAVNDLASRARVKKLKPAEVQDGTFSITNMGSFGSLMGFPIINQPQVAILGVGVIQKRPMVINEAIAIRDMMYISLSFDHRIVDGALAGQFLDRITYYLTNFDTNNIF
jgi:2-oxoglutarate dehydrogenase E2 component (dihydrolipoamide succinyltransferase)